MEKSLTISSKLINLNLVRQFLEEIYINFSLDRSSFKIVYLGISELVNNAILHGNKLAVEKKVFIKLILYENKLLIEVLDEGDGFCSSKITDPTVFENIKKEHGRGIFIIRQLADDLVFEEGGRKVSILFTVT